VGLLLDADIDGLITQKFFFTNGTLKFTDTTGDTPAKIANEPASRKRPWQAAGGVPSICLE
jgi:hypothetical protein